MVCQKTKFKTLNFKYFLQLLNLDISNVFKKITRKRKCKNKKDQLCLIIILEFLINVIRNINKNKKNYSFFLKDCLIGLSVEKTFIDCQIQCIVFEENKEGVLFYMIVLLKI